MRFERLRAWVRRRDRGRAAAARREERASGEEAVATASGVAAEATPSGMPRVKTERI